MLRPTFNRSRRRQTHGPRFRKDDSDGESRSKLSHYDEAGESRRTINVEGMLIRKRRAKWSFLCSPRSGRHDGSLASFRGRDGILQTSLRTLRDERRRFRRKKRIIQDSRNIPEILSRRDSFPDLDLGRVEGSEGN